MKKVLGGYKSDISKDVDCNSDGLFRYYVLALK